MSHSSPDTNILIFKLVGGRPSQQDDAEDYFKQVKSEGNAILAARVDNEFHDVVQRKISELREFAIKAKKHGSWDKAEDYIPDDEYAGNFASALEDRTSPQNANSELSSWKSSIFSKFERLKRKMKIADEVDLNPRKVSEIEDEIPDKGRHGGEEKKEDARIIYAVFICSKNHRKNIVIISDDKHVLDADYEEIEDIMDFEDFNNIVSSNEPGKFVNS